MGRKLGSGLCKSFRQSVSGNITVMFALGLTALCGAAGAAVDFVRVQNVETKVQAAADAAALAAVSYATQASEKSDRAIKSGAEAEALKVWQENLANLSGEELPVPQIKVAQSNGQWRTTISFEGSMPTSLMGVVGIPKMGYAGQAVAGTSADGGAYWELTVVGDVSPSMLMGNTPKEMGRIPSGYTGNPCGFACHYGDAMMPGTYAWAKNNGVKLRLDDVNDAIAALMKSLPSSGNTKVSLYKFSMWLEEVQSPTSDLRLISSKKLEPWLIARSKGETFIPEVLEALAKKVGKSGSGASASDPRKAVVLLTDGITDRPYAYRGSDPLFHDSGASGMHQHTSGMNAEECDAIKKNGVKLVVVLTRYYAPPGYHYWGEHLPDYAKKAKACASEGLFAHSDTASEIEKAVKDLTGKAMGGGTGAVRLTQ